MQTYSLYFQREIKNKYCNNNRDLDAGVQQALYGLTQTCGKYVNQAKKTYWRKTTHFDILIYIYIYIYINTQTQTWAWWLYSVAFNF